MFGEVGLEATVEVLTEGPDGAGALTVAVEELVGGREFGIPVCEDVAVVGVVGVVGWDGEVGVVGVEAVLDDVGGLCEFGDSVS